MTITANFSGGDRVVTTAPLYQWDTGQKLALSGLPQTASDIQVHFANAAMPQAIVKATELVDNLPTCDVPNVFLQFGSAAKARAWVYYKEGSSKGYTIKTVLIPITPRKRPNDYVSPEDPDSQGIVERAMELLENYQSDLDSKLDDSDGSVKTANLDSGAVTEAKLAQVVKDIINAKEAKSNKKTTLTGNELSNNYYPTTKAVAEALSAKAPASTAYTFDTTTTNVVYSADNPKTIYLNATVDHETGIVITAKDNDFQYFLGRSGTLKIRYFSGGTSYSNWTQKNESTNNKQSSIAAYNDTSPVMYPSIKAVVDYLVANYEDLSNKLSSEAGIDSDSTDTEYPSAKAVYDALSGKENSSNKVVSMDSNSTDTEYPSAKAVYDFGADILTEVAGDLVLKESLSNKKNAIAGNETSEQYYPTTKAVYDALSGKENSSNKVVSMDSNSTDTEYPSAKSVYDYGSQISSAVEDVKAYIGYTSGDILGLHADFENKQFTRLGAAVGLTAGQDFNAFPMYGQRRRVVVDSDGEIDTSIDPEEITAEYLDAYFDYDVMVYQPKFYYKVVPLKLEKQASGLGYHIRKANYYISATPHAGFKVHPLFYDANGNEVDYVLLSAYEASYLCWTGNNYTIFHDGDVNSASGGTNSNIDWSHDTLKSLPNVKPISGQYKAMTKANMEALAQRKSANWHLDTIKSVSANQLLMAIELGSFNMQTAIDKGVVSTANSGGNNCASLTGSTLELGNTTGTASKTIYDVAGTETENTASGKVSVTYRGLENPWGNIWKHVNGINAWGDGTMNGGQVYISDGFTYNESSHSGDYKATGFTLANASGSISAFGYGDEKYDWLFVPSETTGNSSLPVGDVYYCTEDLNGYRVALFGGYWNNGVNAGNFSLLCSFAPGRGDFNIGGRLLYVPTATI